MTMTSGTSASRAWLYTRLLRFSRPSLVNASLHRLLHKVSMHTPIAAFEQSWVASNDRSWDFHCAIVAGNWLIQQHSSRTWFSGMLQSATNYHRLALYVMNTSYWNVDSLDSITVSTTTLRTECSPPKAVRLQSVNARLKKYELGTVAFKEPREPARQDLQVASVFNIIVHSDVVRVRHSCLPGVILIACRVKWVFRESEHIWQDAFN